MAGPYPDADASDGSLSISGPIAAQSIGRYTLLQSHARGGFGEVLLARDEELTRTVALKRLQPQYADDAESRRRFLREAEITARLEHPGVIPVYGLVRDSGERPCLALRFLQGETLHSTVREFHTAHPNRASAEGVVAFRRLIDHFLAICRTVAYAHDRGIIHRDLKPANIMLGRYGEAVILDWGLARPIGGGGEPALDGSPDGGVPQTGAAASGDTPPSGVTQLGSAVGTPGYMSPEQAAGRWDVIGAATDIYSLGAILYFLCTGRAAVQADNWPALRQQIIQGEFPAPRQVIPDVPPALEAICLKAMALRPQDRYRSVLDLAADIEHWLADEPVTAYREPVRVRARRWGRRHRALVAAALAGLIVAVPLMAGGLILLATAWNRTRTARDGERAAKLLAEERGVELQRERDRARGNFQLARTAVDRYAQTVTQAVDLKGQEPRRKELLKPAGEFYAQLARQGGDTPADRFEQARALMRLGAITDETGSKPEAIRLFQEAVGVLTELVAAHPDEAEYRKELATCRNTLGLLFRASGRGGEAEASIAEGRAIREQLATTHPERPELVNDLAATLATQGIAHRDAGRVEEAEAAFRRAIELREKLFADHPQDPEFRDGLARVHNNLGNLLNARGRIAEAEAAFLRAIELREPLTRDDPEDPDYAVELASAYNNLAILYRTTGRMAKAEEAHRKALALRDKVVQNHPSVAAYRAELAKSHHNLAILYRTTGRLPEAEAAFQKSLTLREGLVKDHPTVTDYRADLAAVHNSLGVLYRMTDRPREAEAAYRAALELRKKLADEQPRVIEYRSDLAATHGNLGNLYSDIDRSTEAAAAYAESLRIREQLARDFPDSPGLQADLASGYLNAAMFHRQSGRLGEARQLAEKARDGFDRLTTAQPTFLRYQEGLGHAHAELGIIELSARRPREAEVALLRAREVREKLATDHPATTEYALDLADTFYLLGSLFRDTGRLAEAVTWYSHSLDRITPALKGQSRRAGNAARRAHQERAVVLTRLKRYSEAVPDWTAAAALDRGLSREWVLLQRARGYALMGDAAKAASEAEASAARVGKDGSLLHDAAVALALAAASARPDSTAERYAARAVELLGRAAAVGFFRDPAAVKDLKANSDFEILRDREDFRQLLRGLESAGPGSR